MKADFLKSALLESQYPVSTKPEIAFAGRSNVGKSSLINALLGRRKLAGTSSTPGQTQALNFFLIQDRFTFVDLPGYGYARVPLKVKRSWGEMVETYLRRRAIHKNDCKRNFPGGISNAWFKKRRTIWRKKSSWMSRPCAK